MPFEQQDKHHAQTNVIVAIQNCASGVRATLGNWSHRLVVQPMLYSMAPAGRGGPVRGARSQKHALQGCRKPRRAHPRCTQRPPRRAGSAAPRRASGSAAWARRRPTPPCACCSLRAAPRTLARSHEQTAQRRASKGFGPHQHSARRPPASCSPARTCVRSSRQPARGGAGRAPALRAHCSTSSQPHMYDPAKNVRYTRQLYAVLSPAFGEAGSCAERARTLGAVSQALGRYPCQAASAHCSQQVAGVPPLSGGPCTLLTAGDTRRRALRAAWPAQRRQHHLAARREPACNPHHSACQEAPQVHFKGVARSRRACAVTHPR